MRTVIILLTLCALAFGGEHHELHMFRDLGYLHLDKQQKEQISKIVFENRKKRKELHEEKELAQKRMKQFFLNKKFDKKMVSEMFLELKTRAVHLDVDMLTQIHDVLTPQQRELFLHYIKEWEIE
jgi:periplasmic protein CpxP/Spy